jgi:hypothetical protein
MLLRTANEDCNDMWASARYRLSWLGQESHLALHPTRMSWNAMSSCYFLELSSYNAPTIQSSNKRQFSWLRSVYRILAFPEKRRDVHHWKRWLFPWIIFFVSFLLSGAHSIFISFFLSNSRADYVSWSLAEEISLRHLGNTLARDTRAGNTLARKGADAETTAYHGTPVIWLREVPCRRYNSIERLFIDLFSSHLCWFDHHRVERWITSRREVDGWRCRSSFFCVFSKTSRRKTSSTSLSHLPYPQPHCKMCHCSLAHHEWSVPQRWEQQFLV